jgi:calcineurin-like phosphoesterase family protein
MDRVMTRMGFADVLENTVVEVDGMRLWLNHYPRGIPDHRGRPYARPEAPGPYDIILCGHVHQQFKVAAGNVNVGVDVWNFTPISVGSLESALVVAS